MQSFTLMALWLVLSGYFDSFHVTAGVLSVIAVQLMNFRFSSLQFFPDDSFEWEHLRFDHLLRFIPWLAWEIVDGSIQVALAVLNPRKPIEPALVRFRVNLPLVGAKVILGNVITLTPGTVTLSITDDEFLIHSLRRSSAASIIEGTMPKWIAQIFHLEDENLVSDVRVYETNKEL